ncbi:MAG: branched-chain amino acid ABC transporter permease [Thermofilaceae archaeon]
MIDVLVGALVYSNLLALLAVGLSIALLTCKVSNFAHGDFATVGVYAAYTASVLLGITPYFCIPVAFIIGGLISLVAFLIVFEPLRSKAELTTLMVVSMAVDMIIRYTLHIYADLMQRSLGVYTRQFMFKDFHFQVAGYILPGVLIMSACIASAMMVALYFLLYKTNLGVAMRAAIENPSLAEALGVNVKKVFAISWFLSGALAATAGVFLPFRIQVTPDTGWSLLLSMFASVTVGGLGNLSGSIAGAYLIGFSETLFSYSLSSIGLSTAYRPAVSFTAIIVTLLLSPRGLTGFLGNRKRWFKWRS